MIVHALVLADGDPPTRLGLDAAWPGWDADVALVVAADGGARLAEPLGLRLDAWVGDGDSLGAEAVIELDRAGVPVELLPVDKDESDAEMAVRAAVLLGAERVTILGGLGGRRLDHALANVGLLAMPELGGREAALLDDRTRVTAIDAAGPDDAAVERSLGGRVGDLVSLLPWGGDVDGITTSGLRYPLRDEPLRLGPARGLSNVREAADARVTVRRGRLLVVESPASL